MFVLLDLEISRLGKKGNLCACGGVLQPVAVVLAVAAIAVALHWFGATA